MLSTSATLLTITALTSPAPLITQANEKYKMHCYGETNSLSSVDEGWTRSDKQDDIETFYRYEKIGSDTFQVEVKIVNNRPKSVKVRVQVQYESAGITGRLLATDHNHQFLTQPSQRFNNTCEVVAPSVSSRICRGIKVAAKKITGVKIIRWDNI
jgi:hypothetical protein